MAETAGEPVFLRLCMNVLEDLHVGSGTGGGDIDVLLERDRQGRPVIRDTHFKGLLREAGGELDKSQAGDITELLGSEGGRRGALAMTSLRIQKEGDAQKGDDTLVWGSSARQPGSRVPAPDTLRFIEHVAAGTKFEATLRLPDAGFRPLLGRLIQRIDRVGGDRNRGAGLVQFDPLEELPVGTALPLSGPRDGTRLRMTLRNLEPLCLPATGHPGNLIQTHSFIRGQTLRGALLGWAIRNRRKPDLNVFERISFGDALPLPPGVLHTGEVMPIPLSILTEKPRGGSPELPWWAGSSAPRSEFDSLGEFEQPKEKPKRPGAHEYLASDGLDGEWTRYAPMMRVRLRNATPERNTREDAELFSTEEIAEDTRFQAELAFPDHESRRQFLEALEPLIEYGDWLAIGRGGQPACVESITMLNTPENENRSLQDPWTLTLTSDLILRGPDLGFHGNLSISVLRRLGGLPNDEECKWTIDKQVVETQVVQGFNAVSGLNRAPAVAIRRGSCWKIGGAGSVALAQALADQPPLGERTRDGFGRFVIDLQPVTELRASAAIQKPPLPNPGEKLRRLARGMARQIGPGGPSSSQLQWLRSQALAANAASLEQLLTEIENAPARRPRGGSAWKDFPVERLRQALETLPELDEKRSLISYLVKQLVLRKDREAG